MCIRGISLLTAQCTKNYCVLKTFTLLRLSFKSKWEGTPQHNPAGMNVQVSVAECTTS